MEPVSTIAAVTAVYSGLKSAISVGKDLSSMASDLGKVFDAIDGAQSAHRSEVSRKGVGSANQEALQTFIDKKRADDMEAELKAIVIHTRGFSAWNELVQLRATMRRERVEAQKKAARQRAARIETAFIWGAILFCTSCLVGLSVLVIMSFQGRL